MFNPPSQVEDLSKQLKIAIQDAIMEPVTKLVNDARNDIQLLLAKIEPSTTSGQQIRHEIHRRFEKLLLQLENVR